MDLGKLVAGLAVVIGIMAGIVQVLDYLQKQREKKRGAITSKVIAPPPHSSAMPSNLPPRSEFIGREREKALVREALASRYPITCIDGIGGIGKTALALEVANECLQASKGEMPADGIPTFDGFIWTTAKDRELTLNDVLDAIARTLDYLGIAQQPLEEKQESVRRLLQSKRCLVIVDNFETVKDSAVRDFLLRLPEPSKVLITSREQKLRQAWAVSLKGLEPPEALTLIRSEGRRLGLASMEKAEERVLLRLYKATGGAPLAIKWAVGQIKQKGQTLDRVLAALYGAKGDIFEEVFARSWSLLTDDARRILMVMPIFVASASRDAIEAASDVHHYGLDEGLGQLVEMWLVEATDELDVAKRRYSIHPLTRAYAGAKLRENADWEREARLRAADYFVHLTERHGWRWDTQGITMFDVQRLEPERENVLAIMDWCYETGEWQILLSLALGMSGFLGLCGYWQERLIYGQRGAEAAEHIGDDRSLAWLSMLMAWVYLNRGSHGQARSLMKESQVIFERIGAWEGTCVALRYLGRIARETGAFEEAKQLGEKALEIARVQNHRNYASDLYRDFGTLALEQGQYAEAQQWCQKALDEIEKPGNEERLGNILIGLASAKLMRGEINDAGRLFETALELVQMFGRQDNIAHAKHGLAKVNSEKGDLGEALKLAREALGTYVRLEMRQEANETKLLVRRLEKKLSVDR